MTDDRSENSPSSARQQQFDEVLADLMRAIDADETVDVEKWLSEYPQFATELREFFARNERLEKLVRPLRQAVANVLHVRCPHCHNPIELLDQAPLWDISCPSCGSSFSLIGDQTMSHDPTTKSFGHFELLDRVGTGQFGTVWKARDTKLDRTVAIKIPRNAQLDEAQTELFLRDARAAAQLKHPNIVSVHEVGKQDNTIYIVSDFIRGATLKEWTSAKRLTPREAAELCVKIAKALHHAHEAGVIHRDLKPGNIMMDTDGEPHIVDFGLAKREAGEITMTVEGQILGTPAYMSPEQARGEGHTADRRADIYSLGVILFELLTGEIPFRGDKQMLLVQILKDEPPSLRKLNSSVPRDLETICLKCLEKEPNKRYATIDNLADDLQRWQLHQSIVARRSGALERTVKWARRKPAVAGLVGVSCTAAVIVITGLIVSNVVIKGALDDRTQAFKRVLLEEENTRQALHRERIALSERTLALAEKNQAFVDLQESLQREQQVNYYRAVDLAWREWQAGHLSDAEALLLTCREDRRSWEWHYLMRLCNPVRSLKIVDKLEAGPFTDSFFAPGGVQISGDGRFLAMVAAPHRILVLDAQSGEDLFTLQHDTLEIRCLAISSDGRLLAGAGQNGFCVWDIASREIIKEGPGLSKNMNRLYFSPDGKRLIATHDRYARVHRSNSSQAYKVATAVEIRDIKSARKLHYVARGACSPDGRLVASKSQSDVILHVVDDGSVRRLTGLKDQVANVAFSPDGSRLAGVDMYSNVIVWGTASGEQISSWSMKPDEFDRFLFSPDAQTLAILTVNSTVRMWDVNVGQQVAWFRGSEIERIVKGFAGHTIHRFIGFNRDGSLFASASGDHKLTVWNLKTRESSAFRSRHPIRSVMFDPANSLRMILLTQMPSGKMVVQDWNLLSRHESRLIYKPGANYHTVAISHDGRKIASLVKTGRFSPPQLIKIWDSATGKELQTLETSQQAFDVTFSPDDSQIVVAGAGAAVVFDLATQDIRHTVHVSGRAVRAAYSQDGTRLLIAHGNATIWNLATNQQVISFAARGCVCAVYNQDESLVATCDGFGGVSIWNAQTGDVIQEMSHSDLVEIGNVSPNRLGSLPTYLYTVAFNHDSTRVAACGKSGWVGVWDVTTGKLVLKLRAHKGQAFTVAFSPDGRRLISMGEDRVIRVWDSRNGQKVLTLRGHADKVYHAMFDREGARIVSTSADGTIRIWDGTPLSDDANQRD